MSEMEPVTGLAEFRSPAAPREKWYRVVEFLSSPAPYSDRSEVWAAHFRNTRPLLLEYGRYLCSSSATQAERDEFCANPLGSNAERFWQFARSCGPWHRAAPLEALLFATQAAVCRVTDRKAGEGYRTRAARAYQALFDYLDDKGIGVATADDLIDRLSGTRNMPPGRSTVQTWLLTGGARQVFVQLCIQLEQGETNRLLPDPARWGVLDCSPEFLDTFAQARRFVQEYCPFLQGHQARWWLEIREEPPILDWPCSGVAVVVALMAAIQGLSLDERVAVCAGVGSSGALESIPCNPTGCGPSVPPPYNRLVVHSQMADEIRRVAPQAIYALVEAEGVEEAFVHSLAELPAEKYLPALQSVCRIRKRRVEETHGPWQADPLVDMCLRAPSGGTGPSLWEEARRTLASIGPTATSALARALTHSDPQFRRRAAEALGDLPWWHATPPAGLVQLLADHHHEVKIAAIRTLATGRFNGIPSESIIPLLTDGDADVRRNAVRLLNVTGPNATLASLLLGHLVRDPDREVRALSAESLGRGATDPSEAVPALCLLLRDEDRNVRAAAARALGMLGPEAVRATLCLAQALRDDDIIHLALRALERIGSPARVVTKALLELFSANRLPQPEVVTAILRIDPELVIPLLNRGWHLDSEALPIIERAVRSLGPSAEEAAPGVIRRLSAGDHHFRVVAIQWLRSLTPSARTLVSHLLPILTHDDREVRLAAAEALERIGVTAEDVPALGRICTARATPITGKLTVLNLLGSLGQEAKGTLPDLIGLLGEERDWESLGKVKRAIERVGVTAEDVPALVRICTARATPITGKLTVLNLLGSLGREAEGALPNLIAFLDDSDYELRYTATRAIERIGLGPEHVATLVGMLHSGRDSRDPAIILLGSLGRAAGAAVPDLVKLLEDPTAARHFALEALKKIGHIPRAAEEQVSNVIQDSPSVNVRAAVEAFDAFGVVELEARFLPVLSGWIAGSDLSLRLTAVDVLGQMSSPVAVGLLIEQLSSPNLKVLKAAALALGSKGAEAAPAVPALVRLLGRRYPVGTGITLAVISTLGEIGTAAGAEARSALAKWMGSLDGSIARAADGAFRKVNPNWYESMESKK